MQKIRLGIIGMGNMGSGHLQNVLDGLCPSVTVTAVSDINPEKLEQVKENVIRNYDGLADSPWAMVDYFAEQVLQDQPLTTEKFLRQIEKADMDDIMQAADHLELRVVYLLRGKEDEHGAE